MYVHSGREYDLFHSPLPQIVPVQSLPGREGVQIVMGAISQLEDGKFFLEDLTGVIELDLSRTISSLSYTLPFPLIH